MKIGFVIPARLKSTRLPKKILMKFNEQTALEWAIDRAKSSKFIDEVVVATTGLNIDAEVSKICIEKGVRYFQGSGEDVLERFRDTARYFDFDFVVNITPDNTLFSPYLIDIMVSEIKNNPDADYFNFKNAMLGTGIYALKREALETVCEFKNVFETEIWGVLFQEEYFNIKSIEMPEFLRREYRLTLDTPDDYKFLKKIYADLKITKNNLVELWEIIDYLDNNPEVVRINSNVIQAAADNSVVEKIKSRFEENKELFYSIKNKIIENRRY